MLIIVYGKSWTGKTSAVAKAIAKNNQHLVPNLHVLLSDNLKNIREYGQFAKYYHNMQDFTLGLTGPQNLHVALEAERIDGKPIKQVLEVLLSNVSIPTPLQCIVVSYLGAMTNTGMYGQLQRMDTLSMKVNVNAGKTIILDESSIGEEMEEVVENLTTYGITHMFLIVKHAKSVPLKLLRKAAVLREQRTPYDPPIFIAFRKG